MKALCFHIRHTSGRNTSRRLPGKRGAKTAQIVGHGPEKIHAKHYNRRTEESYTQAKSPPVKTSLISRLRPIQFDAPEDFSAHLEHYANGEKPIE